MAPTRSSPRGRALSRAAFGSLIRLRRHEEKMARWQLAQASEEAARAQASLGPPPSEAPLGAGIGLEAFLAARAKSHLAWAAWGERLGRAEEAIGRQEAAKRAWAKAASDLKAIERLVARWAEREGQEAARVAQREVDEVAIGQWRRSRRVAAGRA